MKLRIAPVLLASVSMLAWMQAPAQGWWRAVQDKVRHVPRRSGTG